MTRFLGLGLAMLLLCAAAACTAGPPNTPQANRVQDRAMTGQTE